MLIRNTKNVSVNEVQDYLIRGANIHPLLYNAFLDELVELEFKKNLCLVPSTRLEIYSNRVASRIAQKLAA